MILTADTASRVQNGMHNFISPVNTSRGKDMTRETELLNEYRMSGDRAIVEEILAEYYDTAYHIAWAYAKNEHSAADIVQNAMMEVVRSLHTCQHDALKSWIMKVTVHACHAYSRTERRLKRREAVFAADHSVIETDGASSHGAPSKAGDRFGCKSRYGKE